MFIELLNMSISASWVVLAVIILRLVLRKAPKALHCALWALVAFRLICPISFESNFSLMPSTEVVPEEYLYMEARDQGSEAEINLVDNPVFQQQVQIPMDETVGQVQTKDMFWTLNWFIGMCLMGLYALISYLLVRRKAAASIRIGQNIRLCDHIETPFILGIVKPQIYLPSNLDQKTADHVLAHEYAHLKRKDHWWKPLGFALLAVYWFNPVMWLAYILLCRDIEMACDEKVIKDLDTEQKKAYSSALLSCSVPRHLIAACPLAFGEVGVKDRIKSVLNYKKPAFWIIVMAIVVFVIVAFCFLTDPAGVNLSEIITGSSAETLSITVINGDRSYQIRTEDGIAYVEELLNEIQVSKHEVSQSRDEDRDQTNTIILHCETMDRSYHFNTSCTEVWYHDQVKPTMTYRVKNADRMIQFFASTIESSALGRLAVGGYVPVECVYMNPLSSYYPGNLSSDFHYEVLDDAFAEYDLMSGDVYSTTVAWQWRTLTEAREDLEFFIEWLSPDMEGHLEGALYQKLDTGRHLLSLSNGDLLLISGQERYHTTESVWSIYRLLPVSALESTYEIFNVAPLEELPETYNVEEASIDQCVIMIDGDVRENQDVWEKFAAAAASGTEATVRYMEYWKSTDHSDSEKYIYEIIFDGVTYTRRTVENGSVVEETFRYLLHFTGTVTGTDEYDAFSRYVLSNEQYTSWEEVRSLIVGDIPVTVYSDLIDYPDHPQIPELTLATLERDGKTLMTIKDSATLQKIRELFSAAEDTFEPKTYGFLCNLVMTGSNGETVIAELAAEIDLCRIGGVFYDYGPGYDYDGVINAMPDFLALLGLTEWPQEEMVSGAGSGFAVQYPDGITEAWLESRPDDTSVIYMSPVANAEYDASSVLDSSIRNAIMSKNVPAHQGSTAWLESHVILSELVACGLTESAEVMGHTTLCVLSQLCEVQVSDGEIEILSTRLIPAVISFDESEDHGFTLTEYWQADANTDPIAAMEAEFSPVALENLKPIDEYVRQFDEHIHTQALHYYDLAHEPSIEELIHSLADDRVPFLLSMHQFQDDRTHSGWGCLNDIQYARSMQNYTFEEIDDLREADGSKEIRLLFTDNEKQIMIGFFEESNDFVLYTHPEATCYRATHKYGDTIPIGTIIRSWYDAAQYEALQQEPIIIADTGQTYLEAAQEFCERYEGLKLKVDDGSMYRYSYVSCQIEEAPEATIQGRVSGDIDQDGYAFWLTVTFVPENDRAWQNFMAGNTHEYNGSDPDIPDGAWEYTRCGYIRLTEDGWIGEIVGSGW